MKFGSNTLPRLRIFDKITVFLASGLVQDFSFRHEIANSNPSHPIQKNQQRNPVLTPKENIKHRKILATRNQKA
jgi:hypothetical protein